MVCRTQGYKLLTKECETISEELLKNYLKTRYGEEKPVDIAGFAIKYLHLNLEYDNLSPDKSICGILKDNSVIVDYELPSIGRIRFTIAHECAHYIIRKTLYKRNPALLDDYYACELMADKIASCLLMPKYLMEYSVRCSNLSLPLTVYDKYSLKGYDNVNARAASNLLKVSKSAYINRLRDLGKVQYGDADIGNLIPVIR